MADDPHASALLTASAEQEARIAREVGQIGGGKRRPNGRLDVAMIQSLVRKGDVDDTVATYGHVVVDECHHVPAVSFERVLSEAKARYVLGLTATPHRRDFRPS